MVFRRISRQITTPNGLWDAAGRVYPLMGAQSNRTELSWRFPSGARVQFGHLQHPDDVFGWQGSELDFCGFDELTHFEEEQFWYILSRLRSTAGIRPYVRATTNPAPGWVRNLLAPWVVRGYSGPGGPAQSGEIRHFVRREGEIVWLVDGETMRKGERSRSITFIRSSIHDNRVLLESDPDYLANLMALPEVERKRLLEGDWDVFEGAFFPEWDESKHCIVPPLRHGESNPERWRFFGGLDWGYAAPFAFVLCGMDYAGRVHVLESVQHKGLTNEAQAEKVRGVLSQWGIQPGECTITFDPSMLAQKTVNGLRCEADIEAFYRAGLNAMPADKNRRGGWSTIRSWLTTQIQGEPAIRVWRGYNADLMRMLPMAQFGDDGEDMDESIADGCGGHWDVLNALRYALRTRPSAATPPEAAKPRIPWQFDTGEHDLPTEIR